MAEDRRCAIPAAHDNIDSRSVSLLETLQATLPESRRIPTGNRQRQAIDFDSILIEAASPALNHGRQHGDFETPRRQRSGEIPNNGFHAADLVKRQRSAYQQDTHGSTMHSTPLGRPGQKSRFPQAVIKVSARTFYSVIGQM